MASTWPSRKREGTDAAARCGSRLDLLANSRNVLGNKKNPLRDKNKSREVGLRICSFSLKKRGMLTYWKIRNWG